MASTYPGSLDAFTNPTSGDTLNSPSHSGQHADANDAIEALEAKLGVGSSPASGAATGHVLVKQADGTTAWASGSSRTPILVPASAQPDLGAGTWTTFQFSGSRWMGMERFQGSAADGQALGWDVSLVPGTYRLDILHSKGASSGIIVPNVDGTDLASEDCYSSSTTQNRTSRTGITVTTSGLVRVKFTLNGKNASSSNFFFIISGFSLTKTG